MLGPARTEAGTRLYARKDLKRMEVALRLSLELIRRLATLRGECLTGTQAVTTVLPQLSTLQTDIRANIEQLGKLEHDIEIARGLIRTAR